MKNYSLNEVTEEKIKETYNLVMKSSGKELRESIVDCIQSYIRTLPNKKFFNEKKSLILKWHTVFYNLARERAEGIGVDVSLFPKKLEDVARNN
jgi:hypothetical protein